MVSVPNFAVLFLNVKIIFWRKKNTSVPTAFRTTSNLLYPLTGFWIALVVIFTPPLFLSFLF